MDNQKLQELKSIKDRPEQYKKTIYDLIEYMKNSGNDIDLDIDKVYTESKRLGYSPIEYIVDIAKVMDYKDVGQVWSDIYGVPYKTDAGDLSGRHDWYVEFKDGSIGVFSPVDYIKASDEIFKDRKVYLVPYYVLQIKDIVADGIRGYFYELVQNAQKLGVTDIHFEIREYGYDIKYRLIGDIVQSDVFPIDKALTLQQIIKNIASKYSQIDVEQWKIRQDARIEIPERKLDLRLAFTPSLIDRFQNITIRLLSKEPTRVKGMSDVQKLGYYADDAQEILKYNNYVSGLNLMSGATGSGKSRSLNTFIALIPPNRKIMTVEDPVEYVLENAVQHQTFNATVQGKTIAMDYLQYTIEFMRMDPDIIFVGEWRKIPELTEALLYASETGHLVYSTLHSSRIVNIPNLLVNQYGLKKEDIANNVNIFINQRLVKKVCPHCHIPYEVKEEDINKEIKQIKMIDKDKFYSLVGKEVAKVNLEGCEKCRIYHPFTKKPLIAGYIGRTVLYEYMPFTLDVRTLVSKTTSALEIEKLLVEQSKKKEAKSYMDTLIRKVLDKQIDLQTSLMTVKG